VELKFHPNLLKVLITHENIPSEGISVDIGGTTRKTDSEGRIELDAAKLARTEVAIMPIIPGFRKMPLWLEKKAINSAFLFIINPKKAGKQDLVWVQVAFQDALNKPIRNLVFAVSGIECEDQRCTTDDRGQISFLAKTSVFTKLEILSKEYTFPGFRPKKTLALLINKDLVFNGKVIYLDTQRDVEVVLLDESRNPIEGADVWFKYTSGRFSYETSRTSSAAGIVNYNMPRSVNAIQVQIEKDGYEDRFIEIEPNSPASRYEIVMKKGVESIRMLVVDENKTPIDDIRIILHPDTASSIYYLRDPRYNRKSAVDENGVHSFCRLHPGAYRVLVYHPRCLPFEGAFSSSKGAEIKRIVLSRSDTCLYGVVKYKEDEKVPDYIEIEATPTAKGNSWLYARYDFALTCSDSEKSALGFIDKETGEFSIPLPPGNYMITVSGRRKIVRDRKWNIKKEVNQLIPIKLKASAPGHMNIYIEEDTENTSIFRK